MTEINSERQLMKAVSVRHSLSKYAKQIGVLFPRQATSNKAVRLSANMTEATPLDQQ